MRKLPNPFTLEFEYNNKRYCIKDDKVQGMLYLWFYGLNSTMKIRGLFTFYGNGEVYEFKHWCRFYQRLQKVEKHGLKDPNYLGRCLLKLVEDCHKDGIPIENVEQFYTYVRFWILKHIPELESCLHAVFDDINLFF